MNTSVETVTISDSYACGPTLGWQVISQDLQSVGMKNKKHWNSFTTAYFRDALAVKRQLQEAGHAGADERAASEMLKMDLRCHRCGHCLSNFPALKVHLGVCAHPHPIDSST
jgi:aprataxin